MADKPIDYCKISLTDTSEVFADVIDAILEVSPTATAEQIRTAYKKAALRWHPDRVPSDSPERATRTKRFQQINDAYFTLSDATRRRDYDTARQWAGEDAASEFDDDEEEIPKSKPKAKGSWFGFGGSQQAKSAFEETQWSSAFEEMMRDADMATEENEDGQRRTKPTGRFWTVIGAVSGASLGFIVGNFMGAVAGAGAGGKLGAIRDAHGKSVYEVFQTLPQADKAKVLTELATKIFAQALSG